MARGITEFRVPVDLALGDQDRIVLGDIIINNIKRRTREGKDINGNAFAAYNRDYLENLRDDGILKQRPNLDLTGDMLEGLEILDHGRGFILIGIARANRLARLKAGWQQGGNPKIPARRFMGIQDSKIEELQGFILAATPEQSSDDVIAAQVRQQFQLTDLVLDNLGIVQPINSGDT